MVETGKKEKLEVSKEKEGHDWKTEMDENSSKMVLGSEEHRREGKGEE